MWQPRSERLGLTPPDGPYPGVPDHLANPLFAWMDDAFCFFDDADGIAERAALRLRVALPAQPGAWRYSLLLARCRDDPSRALDVLELLTLSLVQTDERDPYGDVDPTELVSRLRELLELAGSLYTVTEEGYINERVGDETSAALVAATAPQDAASQELHDAWQSAYGRAPDASDAWDHAIKAVEAIVNPNVIPNDSAPTLGKAIHALRDAPPGKFETTFAPHPDHDKIAQLKAALELVWVNPDRHQGGTSTPPELRTARAVVNLAVALIQCDREDYLIRLRPTH